MRCALHKRASPPARANSPWSAAPINGARWDILLALAALRRGPAAAGQIRTGLGPRPQRRRRRRDHGRVPGAGKPRARRKTRRPRRVPALRLCCPTATCGKPGDIEAALQRQWQTVVGKTSTAAHAVVISGASGAEPATSAERKVLTDFGLPVRATGTYIGHGVEAQFLANLGIGCAVLEHGKLFGPTGSGDTGDAASERVAGGRHQRRHLARRRARVDRADRLRGERLL